jgi:hypothetical protein
LLSSLPIGALTVGILLLFLHVSETREPQPLRRQITQLDPLGTIIFLPGVIAFLIALQWGGTKYPWSNGRIIALLVLAGVLSITFFIVQIWRQEDATVPPRIIRQRSIACGTVFSLCVGGGLISMLYSLAIWFQAVKGTTAVQSGIDTIPMVLSLVVGAIMSGGIVRRTGYYVPWMFVSTVLMSIGSGLTTTFDLSTGHSKWIGYQVLFGFGLGTAMQQPSMAAQTVLDQKDVSTGVSLMFFSQSLGGAIFVCIGQVLFRNYLASTLRSISGINIRAIFAAGATDLAKAVPADKLTDVLTVYNDGLRKAFIVAVAVSCLMVLPAIGMEWRSIKEEKADSTA